jgi:NAD(P)-dependent dehydrogenase (short-subunit alcohol dehydrogenase family)
MSSIAIPSPIHREPELLGQTVVVIGGSAGIGFETARRARTEGAKVILTGRNAERLQHAASEVNAMSTAAFDVADPVALDRFFRELPTIDHVMVTAGRPYYGRLADMELAKIRELIGEHLLLALYVARYAASKVRPGGTLIFMGGTGGRRPAIGMSIAGAGTAALRPSSLTWRLKLRPCESTSSPPDSSTRRCPQNCWPISSKHAATSFAPRFPSDAWSGRRTWPRSPCTLGSTPLSRAQPMTSTADSSSSSPS